MTGLCALILLAGCGKEAEQENQRLTKELETARAELETVKTERANLQSEVARMSKDNENLLRLRNENRQLRDAQKLLSQQAQTAATQAQQAQAEVQRVQALAQAQAAVALRAQEQARGLDLSTNSASSGQVLTPEQQAFAKRYGLNREQLDGVLSGAQVIANGCINNLRQLDAAKQQWALENKKTADAIPSAQDITAYLKDGALPKCPAAGAYTLNAVSAHPACSVSGHALPQ